MHKNTLTKVIALASVVCFQHVQALPLLTVKLPGNSVNFTTTVNSLFDAKIFIDAIPDLGFFDFSLTFNSAKLSAESFDSASIFGDANTESLANTISPGVVRLAEAISGTSPLTAGLNITAPTLLGTVHFKALSTVALSPIDFLVNNDTPILSDFNGNSVPGSKQNTSVTINPVAAVPLPAAILSFVPGLFAVFGFAKRKVRKVLS